MTETIKIKAEDISAKHLGWTVKFRANDFVINRMEVDIDSMARPAIYLYESYADDVWAFWHLEDEIELTPPSPMPVTVELTQDEVELLQVWASYILVSRPWTQEERILQAKLEDLQ